MVIFPVDAPSFSLCDHTTSLAYRDEVLTGGKRGLHVSTLHHGAGSHVTPERSVGVRCGCIQEGDTSPLDAAYLREEPKYFLGETALVLY